MSEKTGSAAYSLRMINVNQIMEMRGKIASFINSAQELKDTTDRVYDRFLDVMGYRHPQDKRQ